MNTTTYKALLFAVIMMLSASIASAQFKPGTGPQTQEKPKGTLEAMGGSGDDFFSRLVDPSHFSMHQTYSFSMVSGGGGSTGLSAFTNTFLLQPSADLTISADVSAVYSPFSSFGSAFQKSINGIYLSNASLNWKMGDNTFLRVEYNGAPYLNGGYDPMYPFFR
jgi:hypothetical protein